MDNMFSDQKPQLSQHRLSENTMHQELIRLIFQIEDEKTPRSELEREQIF